MENFKFHCPTKIIFGRDTEENVGDEIKILGGKKVLLHYYSDEIIKDIGLYSKVIESLLKNKIKYIEFSGAVPNPRLNLVKKGITICRAENIDFILAIGGGSVIDSAKMIAAGVFYKGDPWDFCMMKASPKKALNLGVILTIAASGSESSRYSVITNEEDWFKKGFTSDLIRPKFAILNPEITFSVPPYHKFSGIIDIISHITERYFTRDDDYTGLLDLYCEATLRNIIEQSKIILNNPNDYNANAEIMWASTIAQNDLLGVDIKPDWEVHVMEENILSSFYDISHGAGIAIILPAWMRYVYKNRKILNKFVRFTKEVWKIKGLENTNVEEIALLGIEAFENFIRQLNLPLHISEAKISLTKEKLNISIDRCISDGHLGSIVQLMKSDILKIVEIAM